MPRPNAVRPARRSTTCAPGRPRPPPTARRCPARRRCTTRGRVNPMTARRHRRPRLLRRPAAGIAGAGRPLAAAAILGLGLLIGGCGDLVQSDGQRSAERPGIANVRQLGATGSTRAEEYRATATALAAKSEASQPSEEKPAGKLGEIVHRLRMPPAERIQIPSLEIDAPVEEVSTTIQNGRLVWQVIDDIVGHHHASANPGEPGNIVLTGHVESR